MWIRNIRPRLHDGKVLQEYIIIQSTYLWTFSECGTMGYTQWPGLTLNTGFQQEREGMLISNKSKMQYKIQLVFSMDLKHMPWCTWCVCATWWPLFHKYAYTKPLHNLGPNQCSGMTLKLNTGFEWEREGGILQFLVIMLCINISH